MFAKSKSSSSAPSVLLPGHLENLYQVGKQSATAGPENAWRIYDGYTKRDGKEISIFFFDKRSVEKLHKPKRKETVTEILRRGARQMELLSHPKILQAYKVEECADSLAFASEPVLASLANVLAYQEQQANSFGQAPSNVTKQTSTTSHRTYAKEYELLDIEIKYGLLQITEALLFLHNTYKMIHRNICPSSIIITKRGTWKLSGLEFMEKIDGNTKIQLPPWTNRRMSKITQPNLDYIAPEVQRDKEGGFWSDMYSFGMTIFAIFNQGRPLIQARHSASEYLKQIETLEKQVGQVQPLIPLPLRDVVSRMLYIDPEKRPNIELLSMIKYFQDPLVHALQFLDVSKMKGVPEKEHFYTNTLIGVLPYIPKKLRYQHIWTHLQIEMESTDVQSAVLQPVLYIVQNSTQEEYDQIVFPPLGSLFSKPKSIHGTVTLLENLHLILEKTPREYVESMVLPMLYTSFDNSTTQVQTAAFVAVSNITEHIDDEAIRNIILPKLLQAFEKNSVDNCVLMNVIPCILNRLEQQKIIDCILPLLYNVKLQEPEMIVRVATIYRIMLTDKKYGLSVNWMATRAMPSLLPQTVNSELNLEQFKLLFKVLQDMFSNIERNQRNQFTLDNLSLSNLERYRNLRQYRAVNIYVPPFNIPNLRVEQRKTSSAEDMARNNSPCSIPAAASAENMPGKDSMTAMFRWFSSSNTDNSNYLKVVNTFTGRRLSDNPLSTPKIRVAASCESSPGGTPGDGRPIRRHSSTGAQDRRASSINLSPPLGGGMPITSSSVPYLFSSSMNSIMRGFRRSSASSTSSQQGDGLLQQVGSSMCQFINKQFHA